MASCLTQALALQALLTEAGYGASLYIGIARGDARGFEAHAWVECNGEVLIGNLTDLERFTVLSVDRADGPMRLP